MKFTEFSIDIYLGFIKHIRFIKKKKSTKHAKLVDISLGFTVRINLGFTVHINSGFMAKISEEKI